MKRLIDIVSDAAEGWESRKQEKEIERELQARH